MKLRKNSSLDSWGIATGLLMFSFVSLIGIAFRVEPFAIAQRATCCAIASWLVAKFAVRIVTISVSGRR